MKAKFTQFLIAAIATSGFAAAAGATEVGQGADAAQQAINARNQQMAILPMVIQAVVTYGEKCSGGQKSNCGPWGSSSCECFMKAADQYNKLMASINGANQNADQHSSGGSGSGATPGQASDAARVIIDKLAGEGYRISPDGKSMTTPDGSTVAASSGGGVGGGGGGSGSGSGGLTLPDFQQGKAQAVVPGGENKDGIPKSGKSAAMDAGGGGGGGPGSRPPNRDDGALKGRASVSGMSKKFGKDTIGVAGDNIFEMVTRRYKANEKSLQK